MGMTTWVRRVLALNGLWMVLMLPIVTGAQAQPEQSEAKRVRLDLEPLENQTER